MTRTVIAGGGVVCPLTALERARAGHRVTPVGQGPLPDPHAASYDVPSRRRGRGVRGAAGVLLADRVLEVAVHRLKQTVLYRAVPREHDHAWVRGAGGGRAWPMPPVADAPLGLSAHEVARAVPALDGRDAAAHRTRAPRTRFAPLVSGLHPGREVERLVRRPAPPGAIAPGAGRCGGGRPVGPWRRVGVGRRYG